MGQPDQTHRDFVLDKEILSFDGRVLEYFLQGQSTPLARIHLHHLAVAGHEPDNKGRVKYVFSSDPDMVVNKYPIKVPSERNGEMQTFLMAIKAEKDRLAASLGTQD